MSGDFANGGVRLARDAEDALDALDSREEAVELLHACRVEGQRHGDGAVVVGVGAKVADR